MTLSYCPKGLGEIYVAGFRSARGPGDIMATTTVEELVEKISAAIPCFSVLRWVPVQFRVVYHLLSSFSDLV